MSLEGIARRRSARPRILAALLLVALPALGRARADEPDEWQREAGPEVFYVSPTDAAGNPTHVVLRIVDDVTGDPLPGASAALHSQTEHPITGLVAADRTEVADEDGWVRIRADDLGWTPTWTSAFWTYVEAPGHAGLAVITGRIEGEVRLARALDAVVEVRDALDRPVAGAVIGVRSSRTCGHMADQRIAVSDLGGRAVIPGLGLEGGDEDAMGWECWVVADSIRSEYHDLVVTGRPHPPQILRHGPSQPIEGTILEADGTPAVGVHVGALGNHRGPWTTTGAGGHFRVVGAATFAELTVIRDEEPWDRRRSVRAPPAGTRRILRLEKAGEAPVAPELHEIDLTIRDAGTTEDVDERGARLTAVRDGDGLTFAESDWSESTRLPAGSWTLLAGGGASLYAAVKMRLDVPDAKDAPPVAVTMELVRQPLLRIAYEGDPWKASITLVTATDEREVTGEELKAGSIPVPPDVPFVLRVGAEGTDRVVFVAVPAGPRAPDAPPLGVRPPRPVVVHATLVGPDGKPVAGWLRADVASHVESLHCEEWASETPAALDVEASVDRDATVELLAIPEGRALAPRIVPLRTSPDAREKGTFDLGPVRLEPRGDRRLTVLGRAGTAIQPGSVRIARGGAVREWRPPENEETAVDPALMPLETGDVVEVDAMWEGPDTTVRLAKPVRRRLEGPGPWTIRGDYPSTSIVLEATDEIGAPIDAMLVVDGVPHEGAAWVADDGKRHPLLVTGLDAGPHRIAVAAKDRLTHLYGVVLKEGERRVLDPKLRPAPRPAPTK